MNKRQKKFIESVDPNLCLKVKNQSASNSNIQCESTLAWAKLLTNWSYNEPNDSIQLCSFHENQITKEIGISVARVKPFIWPAGALNHYAAHYLSSWQPDFGTYTDTCSCVQVLSRYTFVELEHCANFVHVDEYVQINKSRWSVHINNTQNLCIFLELSQTFL